MKKIITSTISASIILTFISVFNKGIAFFREVLYAKNFGLGIEFNAFLVSSILPITIYSAIYYLSQFYFVPSYNKIKAENNNQSKKFLSDNFWIFFYIGCIITLSLYLLSETIIDFYLANVNVETRTLSLQIFRVYIFTIPISAAHSILAAYLNAEYKFTFPAFSIIILNVTVVLALLLLTDTYNIFVIPFAFVTGMLFQLLFLLYQVKNEINFNPLSILRTDSLSNVFNLTLLFTLIAEIITFSYVIIDRYFLDRLGEGGVASLSYAYQVYEMPVKIFTFAIATIIFSKFSASFHSLPLKELEKQFKIGIKIAIFIFTPIAFLYYFWGESLIKILYERGMFDAKDTVLTNEVLKLYAISLILFSVYAIVNKMIYSAGLLKYLIIISIIGAAVKLFISIALIKEYQQAGLAISTSAAYSVIAVLGFILIIKKIKFKSFWYPLKDIIIYLGVGIISLILTYLISQYLLKEIKLLLFFSPILFLIIYFSTVLNLNVKEVNWVQDLLKVSIMNKFKK